MKSMRVRLAFWFGASFVAVMLAFTMVTFRQLENELHEKSWQKNYPDHPDWKIHGSYSSAEVLDIMEELTEGALLMGIPLALLTFLLGWWLAKKSLQPINRITSQLKSISHKNLNERIPLAEVDTEFRDLVLNINELLARLNNSFAEMSEYAAKVAHELRTPLAILRLKVEKAGEEIDADLSEGLQSELQRLTHVVDKSLLIAKAEQGRLAIQCQNLDLSEFVQELSEDFKLIAQEENRSLTVELTPSCIVSADRKYFRQILHNLLNNALKYGQGNIKVRCFPRMDRVILMIANTVKNAPVPSDQTLGLGLRVVKTLVNLHSHVRYQVRLGDRYYVSRLSFPKIQPEPDLGIVSSPQKD